MESTWKLAGPEWALDVWGLGQNCPLPASSGAPRPARSQPARGLRGVAPSARGRTLTLPIPSSPGRPAPAAAAAPTPTLPGPFCTVIFCPAEARPVSGAAQNGPDLEPHSRLWEGRETEIGQNQRPATRCGARGEVCGPRPAAGLSSSGTGAGAQEVLVGEGTQRVDRVLGKAGEERRFTADVWGQKEEPEEETGQKCLERQEDTEFPVLASRFCACRDD
ncbi:hypothetical protein H8959_001470 [Pygathrix nigripes]